MPLKLPKSFKNSTTKTGPMARSPPHLAAKYQEWDKLLAGPLPDYLLIYRDMSTFANSHLTQGDVELWWRLSSVTFSMGLNTFTQLKDVSAPKGRFEEALKYADKAVLCGPRNFQANLAKGRAIERLDAFNHTFEPKETEQLYFTVILCAEQKKDHPYVLYLDSVVKFAVWVAHRDDPEQLQPYPTLRGLHPVSLVAVEQAILQSMELGLHYFDQYALLIKVLVALKKTDEAKKLVVKCIERQWLTNYERLAAVKLQELDRKGIVVTGIEEALSESE